MPKHSTIILTLLVALLLRLCCLDAIPPGLTHDEANYLPDAVAILDGARPLYFPVPQGKEALYLYSVAAAMTLVGRTPFALRLTSAFWGVLLIPLTYAWTRRRFGRAAALWTAAGLAVSFWGVSTSRMGLRSVTLPPLLTAAFLAARLDGRRPPSLVRAVLGGLLLGLTFYTYLAARLMPAIPILFGLYLLLLHRSRLRERWPALLLMLLTAALVAAPLFLYLHAHPAAEIRVGQLDSPLRLLLHGDPRPFLANVWRTLGVLSFHGDDFIPYNIPGRPLLDPLMSLLFYVGLALALLRWREMPAAFALIWLVVGFAPALATGVEAANLRAIAAQPVLFLFPALTLTRLGRADRRLAIWPGLAALALMLVLTGRDYFVRWANDRDVRVHYHVNLLAIADHLRRQDDPIPVVISTFYPGEYRDPRLAAALWPDGGPSARWCDGRDALIIPPSPAVRLVLPQAIPLDGELWALVAPAVEPRDHVTLRPDDFNPSFTVYRWRTEDTLAALAARVAPPTSTITLGDHLAFLGFAVSDEGLTPGSVLTVLTAWRVLSPLPADRDGVLFSQLLNSQPQVVAQADRLGAPSWDWQPGDTVVQLHRLPLPADLPPGRYTLIAGAYTTPDRVDAVLAGREPDPAMPRLPVSQDGLPLGDHLTLRTWEVAPR